MVNQPQPDETRTTKRTHFCPQSGWYCNSCVMEILRAKEKEIVAAARTEERERILELIVRYEKDIALIGMKNKTSIVIFNTIKKELTKSPD